MELPDDGSDEWSEHQAEALGEYHFYLEALADRYPHLARHKDSFLDMIKTPEDISVAAELINRTLDMN